jgi:hypothetical protein
MSSLPCWFGCQGFQKELSGSWVVSDDLLDLLLVGSAVFAEQIVSLCLSRRLGVGLVKQRLDAEKNLLDGDGGLPAFLLVQDGETDGARRVDVGVKERRHKLACREQDELIMWQWEE